jgi:uncharacterized protein
MQTRLLHDHAGQRTFAVVLDSGDEVMSCLRSFAKAQAISAAQLTALGAFSEAELYFFDWDDKGYESIPVKEQVEVASLTGDVAVDQDDAPVLHVHAVLGRRDGSAVAGHLNAGRVRPTLEVIITESPGHLRRRHDPESGLPLIQMGPDA